MIVYLRKLRGVIGLSLIWGVVWAVMFNLLLLMLQMFLPIDSDVGTLWMTAVIGWVGFVSGAIFATLLCLTDSGTAPRQLSLTRSIALGMLSSAIFPLVTGRANQIFWTCVFGLIVAATLVAIARKQDSRNSARTPRCLENLLAHALTPIRDVISPWKESAI